MKVIMKKPGLGYSIILGLSLVIGGTLLMASPFPDDVRDKFLVQDHRSLPGSAYVISIPPGGTVSIVLPAMCLDFSKKTPGWKAPFNTQPREASTRLRHLLALHEHIFLNREMYLQEMQDIPELSVLCQSSYTFLTPSGGKETKPIVFRYYLDEALQYAVWHNDPNFIASFETNKTTQLNAMAEFKKQVDNYKAAFDGSTPLDLESRAVVERWRRSGQLETEKRRVIAPLELRLAKAQLELKLLDAVESLALMMCQAVEPGE